MKQTPRYQQNIAKIIITLFSYINLHTCTHKLFAEGFTAIPLQHSYSTPSVCKAQYKSQLQSTKAPSTTKVEIEARATSKTRKRSSKKQTKRSNGDNAVPSRLLSDSMYNHQILTREEEQVLGNKISQARKLRSLITQYIIDKNVLESTNYEKITLHDSNDGMDLAIDLYGDDILEIEDFDLGQIEIMSGVENTQRLSSRIKSSSINSKVLDDSIFSIHFDPLLKQDIQELSEDDIIQGLGLPGGKTELLRILTHGINARRKLISCNIKLVISISRNWMRRTVGKYPSKDMAQVYQLGSWDIPSLDEVIHEGTIGLTKAADKFEAKRGNKFSTYATHWITSYVRKTFTNSRTQCLRLPEYLHLIKSKHGKILKHCYEYNEPIPSEEEIAAEIGVNVNRLRIALQSTQSLLSIDAPLYNGKKVGKGSAAGGDSSDTGVPIADNLICPEPRPEDYVDVSILRECLENAMATELSPFERDIIRLRIGLEDGKTRSIPEVAAVYGGAVNKSAVRNAELRALRKLRSPSTMHAHKLMSFLDHLDTTGLSI